MLRTKHISPKKTFAQIQDQWNTIQTLDPKKKFKAMREIGHDLLNSYDKREKMQIEQLGFYMKILKSISRAHPCPKKSKLLSKITADWLELSGNDKARTILAKESEFMSDCPCFCIGDLSYFKELQNIPPQVWNSYTYRLNLINEGKLYELGTGGDAGFNIQLRLVDSLEPYLTSKEMKFVRDCTETAIIRIPTGILTVGPSFPAGEKLHFISTSFTPGNYKMSVFFISKKRVATFCIVLCKTTEAGKNNYQSIYRFSEDYF